MSKITLTKKTIYSVWFSDKSERDLVFFSTKALAEKYLTAKGYYLMKKVSSKQWFSPLANIPTLSTINPRAQIDEVQMITAIK
jgi:hypothetical protein